ncbi:MAG: hypothetical protein JWM53_5870 [bacterium]|nr:hypothetical protein [bacterium]
MSDILKPVGDAVERRREPVAWLTRRRKDGSRVLEMGEATTNPAYRDAHSLWEWVPLYETRPAETMVERERDELVEALRLAHRVIDSLLATLIVKDNDFRPTQSAVWPVAVKIAAILAKHTPKPLAEQDGERAS